MTVTGDPSTTLPTRHPAAARVLPDSVFYGWYIAIGCAALMFVGVGVGYYGLAVFLGPLRDAHGWSNAAVSGATGLYFTVSGITGAVVGPRVDRHGPLRIQAVGLVLLAGAVALVGLVGTLWQLYAVYTLLAVGFGMSTAVGVNAIMARWFVHRRARAMSISFTGVSVGGVVLVPLGTALVSAGGLELASPVLAAMVLAVGLPVVLGVLVWDPRQMGLAPDGGVPPPAVRRATLDDAVQLRPWTRREAIRTGAFWAILVGFVVVLMAQTGFIIHQISFLEERFDSSTAAASALSVTAFGSIVARLIVGAFADRIDKRVLTLVLLGVQGTAVLAIVATESTVLTYALVLVVGFTIGNIYMMQSLLVSEMFGIVSFGTVFGLIGVASQTGSGLGPLAVGWLEDVSGGYTTPFTVTAIATYAAAVIISFARPPGPEAARD
ncbi:MAG TPA: MFS transporter [Acidimicrobiales bacterium]|nr:MFS transporter [Acidimicrobiales bacterium]